MNAFAGVVAKEREKRGWTLVQFAGKTHLDRNFLAGIEQRERTPSILTFQKIAAALGIRYSTLIRRVEKVAKTNYPYYDPMDAGDFFPSPERYHADAFPAADDADLEAPDWAFEGDGLKPQF